MMNLRYVVLTLVTLFALALVGCAAQNPAAETPEAEGGVPALEEGAPVEEGTTMEEGEGVTEEEGMAEVSPEGEALAEPITTPEDAALPPISDQQSELITINQFGEISPESITTDPGTQLALELANLSNNDVTVLIEGDYGATGTMLPSAIEVDNSVTFTRQTLLAQFDEAGEYELLCSNNTCSGSVTIVVGEGETTEETMETEETTPAEEGEEGTTEETEQELLPTPEA
jgi:hypothetical protein